MLNYSTYLNFYRRLGLPGVNYDELDNAAMGSTRKMEAQEPSEQWVSVDEVAEHLKVKPDTVYKWLERKEMPAHKVGRLWRFKITEVDRWVRDGGAAEVNERKVKI